MRAFHFNLDTRLAASSEFAASLKAPIETSREQIDAVRSMLRRRS
jgi:hypothetical protein